MANVRKKISELTALNSASLDTTLLGVDNGITYKIELDILADAVTSRVNILDRNRLSALESYTASFSASVINGTISGSSQLTSSFDQRYVVSGSITQTTWDNIANKPSGIVSQSTDLSSLNTFTASISTASLVNRLNAIENVSGSWITESETGSFLTSLNGAISSSEQVLGNSGVYSSSAQINGNIYSAGSSFTIQDLVIGAGTTSGKVTTDGSKYISIMPTYNVESARFWPNGNVTIQDAGDYVDNGFRLEVSGSTRIVGSLVATDGITGSTNFDTIVNKPTLISGSQQIKDLGFVTGSYTTINEFNNLTQSFNIISGSVVNIQGGFDTGSYQTFTSSVNTSISSLNSYTNSLNNVIQLTGSTVSFLGNIVVYGTQSVINSQNVEISDNILYLSPTASTDNDLGVVGHYNDGTYRHAGIFMDASDGHSWKVFKGLQTETTATVDTSGTGFTLADFKAGAFTGTSFNGQINSTNGVISGSAQITSLGFVSGSYETTGRGIISSSANLVTTSSFNSYTASISTASLVTSITNLNSATSSLATTGSNSFNGNQTITGSLVVSAVAVVNGGVTIPTGSTITLTSGSSISVDSSGAITGSLTGSVFGIGDVVAFSSSVNSRIISGSAVAGMVSGSSQLTSSFDTRYALSASFVSSSNLSSIRTITSASYAALTPVSGTLYIIIG